MSLAQFLLMRILGWDGVSLRGVYGSSWKQFTRDLKKEISEDNIFNGAAALGYYFTLALFPAMLFLLSLIPYIAPPGLQESVMDFLNKLLPGDAARMFESTVREVLGQRKDGLLSLGALLTLWAASTGIYAIMQQLNITYDIVEGRSFLKVRAQALLLTLSFGVLVLAAFSLIILGKQLEQWVISRTGSEALSLLFNVARWTVICLSLFSAFAMLYYFGPDVEQEFIFITPGSVLGSISLIATSLGFKLYVENFGNYNATYGSIGAVIVLMLWLNIMGLIVLLGSEVNALIEHYSPLGKVKGEKKRLENAA